MLLSLDKPRSQQHKRGEGYHSAHQVGLLVQGLGGVEGGQDGRAFLVEQLVVLFVVLYEVDGVGDEALEGGSGGLRVEVQAGVVGDGLVQGVAPGAAALQQAGVVEVVDGLDGAVGYGQRGLLGEAVGLGREDGEAVQGCGRCGREQLVGDGDDRLQGE